MVLLAHPAETGIPPDTLQRSRSTEITAIFSLLLHAATDPLCYYSIYLMSYSENEV